MNNSTRTTCKVKTIPIGPWFLLDLELRIPKRLPMRDYAEFSFDREFAGFSPRGVPLSIKGSAGPAAIGNVPLVREKPEGWRTLPYFAPVGLPVITSNPRLVFLGIRNEDSLVPFALCIHADDIPEMVEVSDEQYPTQANDLEVEKLTPALVNVLVQHAAYLKIVLFGDSICVRVAPCLRLNSSDWATLNRHLFRGQSSGTFQDTASILTRGRGYFRLPGRTLDEVVARWGVGNTKPCGYDGTHLCFDCLHVLQGAKLGRLHRNGELLEGRQLKIQEDHDGYSIPLNQALEAGIVPSTGVLHVDPSLETIEVTPNAVQIAKLKRPVQLHRAWLEPTLICPLDLVARYLVPARQAVRTYSIPSGAIAFRVRTQNPGVLSSGDPAGKYYLLTDLQNLAPRDLKREREERRARHQRLVERYGTLLPKSHEKLTDEQIELYFKIRELVQQGEIIRVEKHPLLPKAHYHYQRMLDWISKEAPHLTWTCPESKRHYLSRLDGFEDLVDIPGFWGAIESVVGEGDWLRRLVTCPKVQAAALISAI